MIISAARFHESFCKCWYMTNELIWNSLNACLCCPPAIIVCWCVRLPPARLARSCVLFFSTHDLLWLCFCVCLCFFFLLALRDVCVANERLVLVHAEYAHTILHLSFTGWGTFWYQVCYTQQASDVMIVCQDWKLYLAHLLLVDSMNPLLELQRPIWTHSALWTKRRLSKDTHLFQTYKKSVSGQKTHNTESQVCLPPKKQRVLWKVSFILILNSLCVYF